MQTAVLPRHALILDRLLTAAVQEVFIWGSWPRGLGTEIPQLDRGRNPATGSGVEVLQKLNQFADIVYIFSLQKRSKFENIAQFPF